MICLSASKIQCSTLRQWLHNNTISGTSNEKQQKHGHHGTLETRAENKAVHPWDLLKIILQMNGFPNDDETHTHQKKTYVHPFSFMWFMFYGSAEVDLLLLLLLSSVIAPH